MGQAEEAIDQTNRVNNPATIWNCWSTNMIYDDGEPGFIIHMFNEFGPNPARVAVSLKNADCWRNRNE